MKTFLITGLLISYSLLVYGNETREYMASKNGVTIVSGGSFDSVQSQKELNYFLDFLLSKIERRDNQIKIFIQTCCIGIGRLKGDCRKEFIFVSYDTLLKRDTIYFDTSEVLTLQKDYNLPSAQNWVCNYLFPLIKNDDLYSQIDVGLKIKYEGFDAAINFYDRIIGIVVFSLSHVSTIKNSQKYYQMPGMVYGMNISILSLDTTLLNAIQQKHYGFDDTLKSTNYNGIIIWSISILLITSATVYFIKRKIVANKIG